MEPPQATALSGLRVINAGQILAAPFCATLLGEFGADVIKLENPESPDMTRGGPSFSQENRGQRGVTISLKHDEGRALWRRLCDTADILIENFRPGTLEKYGVDPESLRSTNPRLIGVRFSGYGQTGPYRDRAGFDRVALGFSGITYVTGYADRPPVRPGYMIADYGSGLLGAFGTLLAVEARQRTGRGQDVDVALYESMWRMSGAHATNFGLSGENRERSGNYFPGVVPAEQFETSDGHFIIINGTTDRIFVRLCEAMGHPELAEDERFMPGAARRKNHEAIHAIVGEWVARLTLERCQAVLDEYGIPASKVYATSDIVADPHYAAREQVLTVETVSGERVLQPGIAPRLTGTPGFVKGRAPQLGEHNREVFVGELGLPEAEFEEYKARGVI
jgi:crotonobetainyl-CoA:carnitine CoA-transferase CaiB-like acyl-CoA transferase